MAGSIAEVHSTVSYENSVTLNAQIEDGTARAEEDTVMTVLSKRIRAYRKKLNKIAQIEESVSAGKAINKEQEEVLSSKPAILAVIDELEKLRVPIQDAVKQKVSDAENKAVEGALAKASELPSQDTPTEAANLKAQDDAEILHVVKLLYFGSLFSTKVGARTDYSRNISERNSCIVYNSGGDSDTPLSDNDLDAIVAVANLISSTSLSQMSHKEYVEKLFVKVKNWVEASSEVIDDRIPYSYLQLREQIERIVQSEFFTKPYTQVLEVNPELSVLDSQATGTEAVESNQVHQPQGKTELLPMETYETGLSNGDHQIESEKAPADKPQIQVDPKRHSSVPHQKPPGGFQHNKGRGGFPTRGGRGGHGGRNPRGRGAASGPGGRGLSHRGRGSPAAPAAGRGGSGGAAVAKE